MFTTQLSTDIDDFRLVFTVSISLLRNVAWAKAYLRTKWHLNSSSHL